MKSFGRLFGKWCCGGCTVVGCIGFIIAAFIIVVVGWAFMSYSNHAKNDDLELRRRTGPAYREARRLSEPCGHKIWQIVAIAPSTDGPVDSQLITISTKGQSESFLLTPANEYHDTPNITVGCMVEIAISHELGTIDTTNMCDFIRISRVNTLTSQPGR